jgi:hypothetical protein
LQPQVPPEVFSSVWIAMLQKILTIDNLVCIGIMLWMCVFCVRLMQYLNHIFAHFEVAWGFGVLFLFFLEQIDVLSRTVFLWNLQSGWMFLEENTRSFQELSLYICYGIITVLLTQLNPKSEI